MLVPPSAEWAEGPPAASATAAVARHPDPLPPELEARLRRQRAQQYSRIVRESLAAAHARQAAKREAAAAAQRDEWETQRAARLARLAERQQVQQQQQQQRRRRSLPECGAAAELQHPADGKDSSTLRAAGAENTSPASLLQAVARPDARHCLASAPASPRSLRDGSRRRGPRQPEQHRANAQQQVLRQRRQERHAVGGIEAPWGSSASATPALDRRTEPQAQAQHPAAAAPAADPLEQLLQELLAAEGAGDPYSIINLYVAEQLQLLQATATPVPAASVVPASAAPDVAQSTAASRMQAVATAACTQVATSRHSTHAEELDQPAAEGDPQVHAALAAGAQQAAAAGLAGALGKEQLLPLQEQPSLKLQRSESAPPTAHHRRSSSLMLPLQLDVTAAAEPAEWSIAAVGLGGADLLVANLGVGEAERTSAAAPAPRLHSIQPQQAAATADIAGLLEQQQGGSKQLYVQQWLQSSAAELAAPESVPDGSSVNYSEDPDQASAQLETLSSQASPAAALTLPFMPAHPAAHSSQLSPTVHDNTANAAASWPRYNAASGSGGASASSRSASAVTSTRRPGAPEPPSSSSQLGGSSSAPSRIFEAAGTAVATVVAMAPGTEPASMPAPVATLSEEQQAAAEDRSCSSSSWDGGSGAGSELQEALSYSQLQAVAALDAAPVPAAVITSAVAAQTTPSAGMAVEERLHSSCSSFNRSGGAPSPAFASLLVFQTAASPRTAVSQTTNPPAAAAAPAGRQLGSPPSCEAYSSDFDWEFEDAEISYGDLAASISPARHVQAATASATSGEAYPQHLPTEAGAAWAGPEAAAAESGSRPSSPRLLLPSQWQVSGGSPPGSAGSHQRPRSPHHAALDDRYPGSPPASGGLPAMQLPVPGATYSHSRPHSPASRGGSPRASGDGGATSHPTSPGLVAPIASTAEAAVGAAVAELQVLEQEDTVVVHSPAISSSSSDSGAGLAGSPYSLLQFGAEPAGAAAAEGAAADAAAGVVPAAAGSPPGTPVAASPGEDYGSCPGSARVEDDTVVQTVEHNSAYLQEVMDYFLQERAEAFAAGAAPYPLELDGYLGIERRRPACGDPQHIWNKLLFDAANEALAAHYDQALRSLTGRLMPRVALLDLELLNRHVTQRVLRWAAMGGSGGSTAGGGAAGGGLSLGGMDALLAEDAAEDERALGQLVGALHAELAAAASRAASPEPAGTAVPAEGG